MYLVASTRCGISAKNLERAVGVSYPTAWRMLNKIRNEVMVDDGEPLTGEVEIDETSVDGKPRKAHGQHSHLAVGPSAVNRRSEAMKLRERSRATVFAAVERGGRVKATVLPSRRGPGLQAQAIEWIDPRSIVYTDEWPAYNQLHRYFAAHSRINHSTGEYVVGDLYTNTIEGWSATSSHPSEGPTARCPTSGSRATSTSLRGATTDVNSAEPSMFAELVTQAAEGIAS
jgi:transposase